MGYSDRIIGLERVRAGDLLVNEANWRTHPDSQVSALRGLLSEVGWAQALLAYRSNGDLKLIDGHLRAGLDPDEQVPVLILDVDDAEAEKLLVSIDPLAAMAEADSQALRGLLERVETTDAGLAALLADLNAQAAPRQGRTDPDEVPSEVEPRTKPGDLWLLGEHRLLCGDATDAEAVERVLGDGVPNLMVTDPPYGVDYGNVLEGRENQKAQPWKPIAGDDFDDEALFGLLYDAVSLAPAPVLFLWHSWKRIEVALRAIREAGWRPVSEIIWVKNALVFGRSDYQWRHECCIYAKRDGAGSQEDRTQTTVWEFPKPHEPAHPTQKPTGLYEIPIQNHTALGDVVYDPFLGSGSAVIASEQLRRRCAGLELDPGYCDVAVARWEAFTGQKAVLDG